MKNSTTNNDCNDKNVLAHYFYIALGNSLKIFAFNLIIDKFFYLKSCSKNLRLIGIVFDLVRISSLHGKWNPLKSNLC